ncbi:LPXTG cell wall anchor domain-containing protein [Streptomyces sp. NBC_00435]|uniref:LPXTG cell wall anchor domain-containing protein n=1 Tax=Streptomyces sp. NBC_00435 TaxID=2903649 RepID=UPI002E231D63
MHLRAQLGKATQVKEAVAFSLQTEIGLAEGNTYPFAYTDGKFQLTPAAPTTPAPTKPAPTTPATPTPAGTPTPANTPSATGSLAHTGSDSNAGLYTGLAGALIALGGAAAWLGARRRNATRG